MMHEMLRLTIETGAGGREGSWCQTAVAEHGCLWSAMFGYGRLCSAIMVGFNLSSPHCSGGSQVCGAVLLGNAATSLDAVCEVAPWVADGGVGGL